MRRDSRRSTASGWFESLERRQLLAGDLGPIPLPHQPIPAVEAEDVLNLRMLVRDTYLPGVPVKLVNLVERQQGLMVRPGNPKGIRGFADLTRDGVTFVNRQAGSGTRVLLDFELGQQAIEGRAIRGYETEEYTHMSVAVAVLSGTVDVGLGIFAAAKALDLDFIPVVTEAYDLVIPREHFESAKIQALMHIINSERFKKRVTALGGYATEKTGQVIL